MGSVMHPTRTVVFDDLRAHVVQPADANGAGVVLMPGWPGLVAGIDQYAQWLAQEGFSVISWDPYHAYPEDLPAEDRRKISGTGGIPDGLARNEQIHCVDYLIEEMGCTHGIGATGICWGGRMSMLIGVADPRVGACSAFFPTLRQGPADWTFEIKDEEGRPMPAEWRELMGQIRAPWFNKTHPGASEIETTSNAASDPVEA